MTPASTPEVDTAGVVVSVRPPAPHRLRRASWSLLGVGAAGVLWVVVRARGGLVGEATKIVAGTAGFAALLMSIGYLVDRLAAVSDLAVLAHGRVRARKGRSERVLEVGPRDSVQLTLDRVQMQTVVATGRGARESVGIAGVISRADAERMTKALHATVPQLATDIVEVHKAGPLGMLRGRRHNRRFDRLWKQAEPVFEEMAGIGRLDIRSVGRWADRGVIEVRVHGDADAARAALAERLPMENIVVQDVREGQPSPP